MRERAIMTEPKKKKKRLADDPVVGSVSMKQQNRAGREINYRYSTRIIRWNGWLVREA